MKNISQQKISIIIPVFNELKVIEKLILRLTESLDELENEFELIFIDDHSTDGTYEYLERYKRSKQINVFQKEGPKGKAYSIQEGFSKASGQIIGMIDADLQYPPEALPAMIKKLENADIVVANRKDYKESKLRKIASKGFKNVFGKLLFGLNHDIQSGLKVFTQEVIRTIPISPKSQWTLDLELLHNARHAGFIIENHDITFSKRTQGDTNIQLAKTIWEIGSNSAQLRIKRLKPISIPPTHSTSMKGAGIGHKRKKYITHTTLPHHMSAIHTFTGMQKILLSLLIAGLGYGIYINPLFSLQIFVGVLSFIYFADVLFNFVLVLISIHKNFEINVSQEEIDTLEDKKLPVYSIFCPLYKEGHVLPNFLDAISKMDYPKDKLDVLLLLEEDDRQTIETARKLNLPSYVRIVVVPHSFPKTKPKACNYGLSVAKGEYVVIYDAEDIPDPLQLKKAFLAFQKANKNCVCLQAKLNYFNPHQNLLTRFFTAEYSLWFDMTLPGLQSLNTALPLGGTSNHFRTKHLQELLGWDPFNVTEDADLGLRLFQKGYTTAIINSTTLEEANSNVINWIRQRSRWIKGYMQTYLVHNREFHKFVGKKGIHAFIFQLTVGGKIAFILINPILWLLTISYFVLYQYVGPTIESFYPAVVFYMAVISLVFGNFLFMYYYMIGCVKREHYSLIKYVLFIPFYWILISIAGLMALQQLIFKPHYWEKTNHGLHLEKKIQNNLLAKPVKTNALKVDEKTVRVKKLNKIFSIFSLPKTSISAAILVGATFVSHVINFIYNAYLGRTLSLSDFGLISLIGGLLYISSIILGSLTSTISYKSAYLDGKYDNNTVYSFWKYIRNKSLPFAIVTTGIWLLLTPVLVTYFHVNSIYPFIIFAPIWLIGFAAAIDKGYLMGKFMFATTGILLLVEALSKLVLAFFLVESNNASLVYSTIPFSYVFAFFFGWTCIWIYRKKYQKDLVNTVKKFPVKFYGSSILNGLSTISFLTLDIVLAKHFLSPEKAGEYALVSLVGKMIFFLGALATQFVTPIISKQEGQGKNSENTLYKILLATFSLTLVGFIAFGVLGNISIPLLYGQRAVIIIPYLIPFTFAMTCFMLSRVFISYYQAKKIYTPSVVSFLLGIVQFIIISFYHETVGQLVTVMLLIGLLNLVTTALFHVFNRYIIVLESNVADFINLFTKLKTSKKTNPNKLNILIFNWRDIKHTWNGGAELYIHEIAKRWAKDGHNVTLFCGNDGYDLKNEVIDGIQIFRRGGTYTVYIWAFLYYLIKFRGKFDVIIDSENGIPFFTPLYTRKPVILLIHHIHQEVFRKHLKFPMSLIGQILEGKLMPFVYKTNTIVTVSDSSKKEIKKIGKMFSDNIQIVHPGINNKEFYISKKTTHPTISYLGRLKPYKNIDTAITAFAQILKNNPTSEFHLIGEGESLNNLKKLVKKLNIEPAVKIWGKVTETEKSKILSESWIVVQPSTVEGWGITVIEANASGTPVIASNVHGLRDSVINGSTGILVEVKNIVQFKQAMEELISNKKYRDQLSKEAYTWSQNFSWDISASLFFSVITNKLDNKYNYINIESIAFAKK